MSENPPAPPELTLARCQHCDALVPVGLFCGNCGAHLADHDGRRRSFAYAAAPGEHVNRAAVVSTLFPHLPHRHAHLFRKVFAAGVAVVLALAVLRLYTPATLTAAVLLPVLYLLYLYEVQVYEQEPVTVVALTFICGAVLGTAYTLLLGRLVHPSIDTSIAGALVVGVLIPIVAQALMVVGLLFLLSHSQFDEILDGLTFGVATALGFTVAGVIAGDWHLLTAPLLGPAATSTEDAIRILRSGVVVAVVNASTTGMITASLWLRWHRRSRGRHASHWRGLTASVAIALSAQSALGVLSYYVTSLLLLTLIWTVAAALLLVWLRVVIHYGLLEEGVELAIGQLVACSHCHRLVPSMLFCSACGAARSAAPKHVQRRRLPGSAAEPAGGAAP